MPPFGEVSPLTCVPCHETYLARVFYKLLKTSLFDQAWAVTSLTDMKGHYRSSMNLYIYIKIFIKNLYAYISAHHHRTDCKIMPASPSNQARDMCYKFPKSQWLKIVGMKWKNNTISNQVQTLSNYI